MALSHPGYRVRVAVAHTVALLVACALSLPPEGVAEGAGTTTLRALWSTPREVSCPGGRDARATSGRGRGARQRPATVAPLVPGPRGRRLSPPGGGGGLPALGERTHSPEPRRQPRRGGPARGRRQASRSRYDGGREDDPHGPGRARGARHVARHPEPSRSSAAVRWSLLKILPGTVTPDPTTIETVGFVVRGASSLDRYSVNGSRGTVISPVLDGSKIVDFGWERRSWST